MRILILGGYGNFGRRIAELLADESRLTLLIAGRSIKSAEKLCTGLRAEAMPVPFLFDRDANVEAQLRSANADIVIDASGPFQSYGADPYRIVKAAIARGVHYLDLADGSGFVRGISQFNEDAKRANVFVLSGASSFPVLTAAATRNLTAGLKRIDSITAGVAPSPYAEIGMNVMRAIASYAGKPMALIRDGKVASAYALTECRRYTIAPPGCLPLANRRFSLVEVPDLMLLSDQWPGVHDVWVGAAPVPDVLLRALNALAWLTRWKLLPSLSTIAPLMHGTISHLRWGEHRGGMFVEIEGTSESGRRARHSWHMIAEGDDGSFIPSMPAAILVQRALDGKIPPAGARAAINDVELKEYDAIFAQRGIRTGIREDGSGDTLPVYRRVLGPAWDALPEPIRRMHDISGHLAATGRAEVKRGNGLLARMLIGLFGFPEAGREIPASVQFKVLNGREHWVRTFGARSFSSTQEAGRGRDAHLVREKFGPFRVGLAVVIDGDKLRIIPRKWSFLGLPLPRFLLPDGETYEHAADGRFNFHVEIGSPLTGLIVAYRGWLVPEER